MTDKTREVLAEMLKENTGTAMCDSGGYSQYNKNGCYIGSDQGYGRNWEQNGCRDFEREAPATLDFRWGSINFTHNLYHWLAERVEYDQKANDLFDAFVDESPEEEEWHSLIDRFPKYLEELGFDVSAIYGEGEPIRINTCNGEDLLSQAILYMYFALERRVEEEPGVDVSDGVYIILQIHGGCDVRGGYTRPRIFKVNEMHGEEAILMNADGHISTENNLYQWYTDDGYHWYEDGDSAGNNLEDIEIVNPDDFSGQITITHSALNPNHATHDLDEDVILVDDLDQGWYRGSRLEGY